MLLDLIDPETSNGPDDFRGPPDELSGPDKIGPEVNSPVAGRTGGRGPEFCLEAEVNPVNPTPCGPDDFLIGSPCLFNGPELVFFKDAPGTFPDNELILLVFPPPPPPPPPMDPVLNGGLAKWPDFLGLELPWSTSNIFPSSPDFFMSPPV